MKLTHLQEARYARKELSKSEVEDIIAEYLMQVAQDMLEANYDDPWFQELRDDAGTPTPENIKGLAEDLTAEKIYEMFGGIVNKIRNAK